MGQSHYTTTYRTAETRQVMDWIKAGRSGCLIGLRGTGKSNFLRFLLRQDIQRHYLGHRAVDYVFILIDPLALTEQTEWAFYELILDRLVDQFRPLGIEAEIIQGISLLHLEVLRSKDPITAQRAVERCVDILCRQPARRIVLLFDEFNTIFQTLDPSVFRCLRAIRDARKDQVSYIVITANDLAHLRDDISQVEHFCRLVSRNTCILGPYNQVDAWQMIHHLASQRSIKLGTEDTMRLIELTGGHAGLLKATLSLLWDAHQDNSPFELAPVFKDEPVVQAECQKIWDGLLQIEQDALCALVGGTRVNSYAFGQLKCKELVREDGTGPIVFSPLFADFVHRQTLSTKDIIISRSPRKVYIDNRCVETLTELEFEMLCYLYEHRGQVCTKDELIDNVYRQRYSRMAGGVSDGAIQALVSRLRSKIEPGRKQPHYILTVCGEGYKFVELAGQQAMDTSTKNQQTGC